MRVGATTECVLSHFTEWERMTSLFNGVFCLHNFNRYDAVTKKYQCGHCKAWVDRAGYLKWKGEV